MEYSNKKIYNEICNSDYWIEKIIVNIDIRKKFITLGIFYQNENELVDFLEYLLKNKNLDINSDIYNKSITITLIINKDESYFDYVCTKLFFPSNTNTIVFVCLEDIKNTIVKINNLPERLRMLKIQSQTTFDLTNLPNNIIMLDLSESNFNLNLDYLPSSISVLWLPYYNLPKKGHDKNSFKLNDLMNLPSSITEIHIGEFTHKSVEDVIKNYHNIKK